MCDSAELRDVPKHGTLSPRERDAAFRGMVRTALTSTTSWLQVFVACGSECLDVARQAGEHFVLWRARYAMYCGEVVTLLEIRCSTCIYRNTLCAKTVLLTLGLVFILPPLQWGDAPRDSAGDVGLSEYDGEQSVHTCVAERPSLSECFVSQRRSHFCRSQRT